MPAGGEGDGLRILAQIIAQAIGRGASESPGPLDSLEAVPADSAATESGCHTP